MSASYTWVGWNRQKIIYDGVMVGGVALYLACFFVVGKLPGSGDAVHDDAMLLIRGLGTCALALLHVTLWIGPLARLDKRFLPLLYNRRHLGVTTFCIGLMHAMITLVQYHGFGDTNPLVSLLATNTAFFRLSAFPFELFGLGALIVLFLMAATSHDYWQQYLSPRAWKGLHMAVYGAYGLVVMHVALGVLQKPAGVFMPALAFGSLAVVGTLHVLAGWREWGADAIDDAPAWIALFPPASIADKAARIITVGGETGGGERIAVFRDGAMVAAVTNLCAHQQGPLGEGRVVDGCITCPWHGYQYRLSDGCAPAPFTEKLATYRLRLRNGMLELDPRPLAPGTPAAITLPGP